MRSFILLVSFGVFAMPVIAQSAPPGNAASLPSRVASTIVIGGVTVKTDQGSQKKLLASSKVRAAIQQAVTKAQARANQCFTLETYAPKAEKLSRHPASVEKPYVPQVFALRSTCSQMGAFEMVPLSAPSTHGK